MNKIKKNVKIILNAVYRKQKIAMLHPGRCGSTVLGLLINQNPELFWSGEPFLRKHSEKALEISEVNKVIKEAELMNISQVYSFATKYPRGMDLSENCIDLSIQEYVTLLKKNGYNKFVFINRENYLRRALSMEKGRKTGVWHKKAKENDSTNSEKITLDPKHFQVGIDKYISLKEYFRQLDKEKDEIFDAVKGAPLLYLSYERDIEQNPLKAYSKYCDFVIVPEVQAKVELVKTNSGTLKSLIVNYSEVYEHLNGTEYAWMLND